MTSLGLSRLTSLLSEKPLFSLWVSPGFSGGCLTAHCQGQRNQSGWSQFNLPSSLSGYFITQNNSSSQIFNIFLGAKVLRVTLDMAIPYEKRGGSDFLSIPATHEGLPLCCLLSHVWLLVLGPTPRGSTYSFVCSFSWKLRAERYLKGHLYIS